MNMYGRMYPFEVGFTNSGEVVIVQDDAGLGQTSSICVTRESVELLCLWLRESAKLAGQLPSIVGPSE